MGGASCVAASKLFKRTYLDLSVRAKALRQRHHSLPACPQQIERMASLGWNTESTLLPKKAKKIAAPNTSMGALKDEVFAASMTAAAAGGKGKYARGTASRRRTDADDLDSAGRKRPRRREARRAREEDGEDDRAAASRRKLEAKARLYDDLRRGEARAPAEFLVTFDDAGAAPAPAPVRVAEQESGGTRWAWGRGEAEAPPSMTGAELLDVAARRAAADRAENDDDAAPRSDTAVKSQWEKTLNRDEKSHLGEIHAEAERERAAAPARQAQEKARVAGLARLIGRLEKDK